MHPRPAALALFCAAGLAGCASPPGASASSALPAACGDLQQAMAQAEQARPAAVHKQESAWKAVIPFAVAARYAQGRSEMDEAEARLAELQAASQAQGCRS